jgi:uncharacterized protein (TIGR00299 family) protein
MSDLLIDMPSGVAGDMLLAALIACGGDLPRLEADLAGLGLGPIRITVEPCQPGGLSALRAAVAAPQEPGWEPVLRAGRLEAPHAHRPYRVIRALIAQAPLPERVRARAQAAFLHLAEAEAGVHGTTPDEVHFHEVGSLDAIADVVGCCLLLEQLGVERIVCSPLVPGHGTVGCAHGRMPVPVPAVARMLATATPRTGTKPTWKALAWETGELTTPTGAALVCALADQFLGTAPGGPLPALGAVAAIGYGAGTKEIPGLVNVVRCTLCAHPAGQPTYEQVGELTCTLDDATGEELGWLIDDLIGAGALDVIITPGTMKKGRPGHTLAVVTAVADLDRLARRVLTNSPAIGIRMRVTDRLSLPRRPGRDESGRRTKIVRLPDGSERSKRDF